MVKTCKTASSRFKLSESKKSSHLPSISKCASIQLLAQDVEEKLDLLIESFVNEEKNLQKAKFNRLNKRSSSLTSLQSDSDSLSSLSSPSPSSNSYLTYKDFKPYISSHSKLSTNYSNNFFSSPSSSPDFESNDATSNRSSRLNFSKKTNPLDSTYKVNILTKKDTNRDLFSDRPKMRFGTDKSSVVMQRSSTHSPLRGTKSQEDLRLSPEFSRLLNSISNWSPKSRYLQLIAEKQSLENSSYKPTKRSHSEELNIEKKLEYKSLKKESKKSDSNYENKSNLRSDSKAISKEPIFNDSKIQSKTNLHTNIEIVHKGKQQDNLDSVNLLNKIKSKSNPNLFKVETKSETKMDEKSLKLISNNGSKSVKKKQDFKPKDNSVEKNVSQELQLTDDEKASILATKQHSLTKRVQIERELDQLKKAQDRLFAEEKVSSSQSSSLSSSSSSSSPSLTSLSSSASYPIVQSNETSTKSESKLSGKDLNKTQTSNFVKKRFINNGFKNGRFEATFKPTQSMVSEARIKWERNAAQLAKGLSTIKSGHTSSHSLNKKCTAPRSSSDGHAKSVTNTVKPFLAKGSVAERVLMFEKRPEIRKDKENKFGMNKIKSNSVFNNWKVQDKNQVSLFI